MAENDKDSTVFSELLERRVIYLPSEIDDKLATTTVGKLLLLEERDSEADITLYITSPGGSTTSGLAIIDAMRYVKPDVSTVAVGLAASMAAVILAAGARGKRLALPSARMLLHQGSVKVADTTPNAVNGMEYIKGLTDTVTRLLADSTGQTVERLTGDMKADFYLTADEALRYGLIDKVIAA